MNTNSKEYGLSKLLNILGSEYSVIGEYGNRNSEIDVLHIECGRMIRIKPRNVFKKSDFKCDCKKTSNLHDIYLKKFKEENREGYELLEVYTNVSKKGKRGTYLKLKHNECGNVYNVSQISYFKNKTGCIKCRQRKKSHDEFVDEMKVKFGKEFEILGKYKQSHIKLMVRHNICGSEYMASPSNLLKGMKCYNCVISEKRLTTNELIDRLKDRPIMPMDEYITAHEKIRFKCTKEGCETIWRSSPNNVIRGSGCPQCSSSKGEQIIKGFLENNLIDNIQEKGFDKLTGIGGGNLRYDFYLPNYNLLIEYQGQYHDGSVSNQTKYDLKRQQEHDRRKRQYAKDNGIELLEIWYYDFDNIEKILEQKLRIMK